MRNEIEKRKWMRREIRKWIRNEKRNKEVN